MKRFFIIFLILFSSVYTTEAQSIRLLVYADTNDSRLGNGFAANLKKMMQFEMILATALDMPFSCENIIRRGRDCSKEQLTQDLQNFSCSSEDIVIFCYFGHGGRSAKDASKFPQMCLGEYYQENFVPLEDVKRVMQKKNPKFCVILGDCCNSEDPTISPKLNILTVSGASETRIYSKNNLLKKLFQESKGILMASGCTAGEYSWYDKERGGFFFNALMYELDKYTSFSSTSCTWDNIMRSTSEDVLNLTRQCMLTNSRMTLQHPQYNFEQTPIKQNRNNPIDSIKIKKPIVPNDLRSSLVNLADDKRNTPSQRLDARAKVLSDFFSPNAVVYIMGADQTTILNDRTIDEYLRHVSTEFNLRNFYISNEKRDANGKITSMNVHEIYVD